MLGVVFARRFAGSFRLTSHFCGDKIGYYLVGGQMSADGKPQAEITLLGQPMRLVTDLIVRFPLTVIIASALLAAGSLTMAHLSLGFRTSRSDLLNPNSDYNRCWQQYVSEFGEDEDVIVVVHSDDPKKIPPVLDELAEKLRAQPKFFRAVLHKMDVDKLRSKGLYHVAPQQLKEIQGFFLEQARPVLSGDMASLNLGGQVTWLAHQLEGGDPRQMLASLAASHAVQAQSFAILDNAITQANNYVSPLPDLASVAHVSKELTEDSYMLANQGKDGIVTLWLQKNQATSNFAEYDAALGELRHVVADAKLRHPNITIGLTGMPVMENDEMESSQSAMTFAGILSFVGVGLLYIAGFGCVRHPLLALAALLLPMIWAFGYIVLSVGHLNILSSAFATIVIGLGSDYGVYYTAQYLRLRGQKLSTREAILETSRTVGPGLVTSAVATAAAFYGLGMSEFPGISELGIIAGGGILLCWLAAVVTLPALLEWSDAPRPPWRVPAPLDVYAWLRPMTTHPHWVVGIYIVCTLALGAGIFKTPFWSGIWYNHNLLDLQAAGLESVELEKSLLQANDLSSSFAVSMARTPEEAAAKKERFLRECPMVDKVREVAESFPDGVEAKRAIIEQIHAKLNLLPDQPPPLPPIPVVPPEQLDDALAKLQRFVGMAGQSQQAAQLGAIRDHLRNISEKEYYRRLSNFQKALAEDYFKQLYTLRAVSNPELPQKSDLPEGVAARFIGKTGCYSLQIFTKANIWDMDQMEMFVRQLRAVDPLVTGSPVMIYESSRELKYGYERGAVVGVLIVFFIVFIDFWSVRMTLLALLPLAASKLQLFGLMGLLGIPLNPANMIVLPLILGIGVDTGVQIIHDYLREPHPYQISSSTASALVINTLMNIVGFGGLMIASHRGLHSLGRVLTLGMACCLLSCLVMPCFLRILPDMRPQRARKTKPDRGQNDRSTDSGSDMLDEHVPLAAVPLRRLSV